MGLSRMKVNRLLAEARERGIVRIEIAAPNAGRLALESALCARYGLELAAVTPAEDGPGATLSEVVGRYAAAAVRPLLRDGMTVALGWGVTLKALAATLEPAPLEEATVAPLLGSLSRRSSIDRFEAAAILAQKLGAECFHLPAPIICDSARSREVLHGQSLVREVLARAAGADLALMSVGGRESSTLRAMGFVSAAEMAELRAMGAVGNFLGYFFDGEGRVLDHPINGRVVGLDPAVARGIPRRVMISGGAEKVAMLRVSLARGWATGLVTDEATAAALLE
jgi:DNA-binding transcriptional regulator LsrR (DeoR family)